MRTKLKITEGIFPMPVLMVATYNEDGSVNVTAAENVMVDGKIDMSKVNAIAFAPYHHGRYDESKSAGNWRSFYSIVVYNEISHTSNYIGTDHCLKFFLPIDCCHSLAIFWKEERFFP